MKSLSTFRTGLRFDLKRYTRAPSLWFIALATPIAAHFMMPDQDAGYAVVTLNEARPIPTAAVLGLELGVLAATLLTPLAYIFLRAGPTRHQPWQVSDITAYSRPVLTIGRWVADTFALWALLAALTVAGLILSLFRVDGTINFGHIIAALWLPAAPSLALVAAIRLFLDARNMTRKWLGDVIFFITWMGLLLVSLIAATPIDGGAVTSRPYVDAFGSIAPLISSVDAPVTGVSIGGATNTGEKLSTEAWRAVTQSDYVASRGIWLLAAFGLAMLAGLIWAPMKRTNTASGARQVSWPLRLANTILPDAIVGRSKSVPMRSLQASGWLGSYFRLTFRHWIWILLSMAAAVTGFLMPFRTVAGPAILLTLIFPFTEASARWQNRSLHSYLDTLGPSQWQRAAMSTFSHSLIAVLVCTPAAMRAASNNELQWLPHIAIICFGVPIAIIALAILTRGAVAGRMVMLIAWYFYLSSGAG
ncbi:MAG: hypothetical protein AAGJ85_05535 [Pseudomonadota bacterium]